MPHSYESQASWPDMLLVDALLERGNGVRPPTRREIEDALEEGAGRLVNLEAEVGMLRLALEELRSHIAPDSPLAHGFVSPRRRSA